MPRQKHYYGENHLHYLTRSTYRRTRLFDSVKFRRRWVETLGELRRELGFKIAGYVLMPEHSTCYGGPRRRPIHHKSSRGLRAGRRYLS